MPWDLTDGDLTRWEKVGGPKEFRSRDPVVTGPLPMGSSVSEGPPHMAAAGREAKWPDRWRGRQVDAASGAATSPTPGRFNPGKGRWGAVEAGAGARPRQDRA